MYLLTYLYLYKNLMYYYDLYSLMRDEGFMYVVHTFVLWSTIIESINLNANAKIKLFLQTFLCVLRECSTVVIKPKK